MSGVLSPDSTGRPKPWSLRSLIAVMLDCGCQLGFEQLFGYEILPIVEDTLPTLFICVFLRVAWERGDHVDT